MKKTLLMTQRNVKMFFKDKALFFTSLITPLILLVLYASFLGNVYRDSFVSGLPEWLVLDERLIDGYVSGQLTSSILAVSCITVAFCSNMLMVQDKANKTVKDLTTSPISSSALSVSYYAATFISTFIVCAVALVVCLVYTAIMGWYLSVADVVLLILDILLLVLFGTAISSVVGHFLSSQGQISAVGSIVSSCYGFISGAYMPISQFSPALQKVISFLPGTYGTSLLRNHAMRGVFAQMESDGTPEAVLNELKKIVDCKLYFFDKEVKTGAMYVILAVSTLLLVGIYIGLRALASRSKPKNIAGHQR